MCYSIRMGIDDLAMSEKTTKFFAESTTGWLLKLIVWEFFCTLTWSGRERSCGRKGELTLSAVCAIGLGRSGQGSQTRWGTWRSLFVGNGAKSADCHTAIF